MKVVGLTGGIGSGKSTVAGFLRDLGVPVYIADEEAKKIMETSSEVRQEIISLLGEEAYQESKPNRSWIASSVFQEKSLLNALNKIIHPKVKEDFETWLQQQKTPYVVYEAAILFENGGETRCDYTILVTAPKKMRIQRLLKRDHATRKSIEARMNAQWSDERKLKLADFSIENKELLQTKKETHRLHKVLLET